MGKKYYILHVFSPIYTSKAIFAFYFQLITWLSNCCECGSIVTYFPSKELNNTAAVTNARWKDTQKSYLHEHLLTSLSAQALSGTRTNLQLLNQQKPFLPWDWAEPITLGSWQFYGLHKLTSKGMHQYTHSDSKAYLTGLIRNKWLMNYISDFKFGCEDRRTFSHISTM